MRWRTARRSRSAARRSPSSTRAAMRTITSSSTIRRLETVYTGDTFGLVYPALQTRGRFALPSTSPTDFDAAEARKSIDKVLSLGRALRVPDALRRVRGSDGHRRAAPPLHRPRRGVGRGRRAGRRADRRAERSASPTRGGRAIAEEAPRFGADEKELLALDMELNAQGLAIAAHAIRERAAKTAADRPATGTLVAVAPAEAPHAELGLELSCFASARGRRRAHAIREACRTSVSGPASRTASSR